MRPGPRQAREIVAAAVPALAPVSLDLADTAGGVLSEQLWARNPLPPFDVSAMDGYAVRGPGPWRLRGRTLAGDPAAVALADGEAIEVATGAALPPGCDGVLRTEHAVRAADEIVGPPPLGRDLRRRGEECAPWTPVLPAGTPVTPGVLALAAALGYDALTVRRAPRVLLLMTGRELLTAGDPRDGRIRDALGPLLVPTLSAMGAVPLPPRRTGDDLPGLVAALRAAAGGPEADLVITTGGTADGPADELQAALRSVGAERVLAGLGVRPGRPTLLSLLPAATGSGAAPGALGGTAGPDGAAARRVPVLSLPGNPLAALAGLAVVGPAVLAALLGRTPRPPRSAVLAVAVPAHPCATRAVPVRRLGGAALPVGTDGAGSLRGVALADGLALIPPGGSPAAAGQAVDVLDIPGSVAGV